MSTLFGQPPKGIPDAALYSTLQRICQDYSGGKDDLIRTLIVFIGGILSGDEALPAEVDAWARQAYDDLCIIGRVR